MEVRWIQTRDIDTFAQEMISIGYQVSRYLVAFYEDKVNFGSDEIMFAYMVQGTQVVAVWACDEDNRISVGTYVERKFRRKGLASRLWAAQPLVKKGLSCSNAGWSFLNHLHKTRGVTVIDVRT